MKVQPGGNAEYVTGNEPSRSIFVIVFAITAIGVQALWIAFLIWLAMRMVFFI